MSNVGVAQTRSVKSITCTTCNTPDLFWSYDWRKRRSSLLDSNNRFHECDVEIRPAECRYCKAKELFWVRKAKKYEMTESYGLPHVCPEYRQYHLDWRESKRIDYALTKKWLKSIPECVPCVPCEGTGWVAAKRKNRFRTMMHCQSCKGMGMFTEHVKKEYLKRLRKKYWPYQPYHKWNPK